MSREPQWYIGKQRLAVIRGESFSLKLLNNEQQLSRIIQTQLGATTLQMEQRDPDATFDIIQLIPHPRDLIKPPAYERCGQSIDNKAHHSHQRTDWSWLMSIYLSGKRAASISSEEGGGSTFLRYVGKYVPDYTSTQPKRRQSSDILLPYRESIPILRLSSHNNIHYRNSDRVMQDLLVCLCHYFPCLFA
jgi:hypothetical protein